MSTSASPVVAPPAQHTRGSDRFLIAIVVIVALLIVVAFVIVLSRPTPTYMPEDTPGGVAYNYLMALQLGEYKRAYSYLSPSLPGYPPTLASFVNDVKGNTWGLNSDTKISLEVGSVVISNDQANVTILITHFYGEGLFSSGQSLRQTNMLLALEEGDWKLIEAGAYWSSCWQRLENCGWIP